MEIRGSGGARGPARSQVYEIRVRGLLEPETAEWLGDLSVVCVEDDESVLTGALLDQAALFGVLLRLHGLGIPLISVNPCANT